MKRPMLAGIATVATFSALLAGCGGSGGTSPPSAGDQASPGTVTPPPPTSGSDWRIVSGLGNCNAGGAGSQEGGIWFATQQGAEPIRLLVAETGEFRWLPTDGWFAQIFGTFAIDGVHLASDDAVRVQVDGLTFLETRLDPVAVWGDLDAGRGLTLHHELEAKPATSGTSVLSSCDSVYARPSSLSIVAGTYVNGPQTLSIDDLGAVFYQSAYSGCVGQGHIEPVDPRFNMYRLEIALESCTRVLQVELNGLTYSGLGYLGDAGNAATNDVAEFALAATRNGRVVLWNLLARR